MRPLSLSSALTASLFAFSAPALAQSLKTTPAPVAARPATGAATAPAAAPANPIIVTVNNEPIRVSDVAAWVDAHVPAEQRQQISQEKLFQAAVNQLATGKALEVMARKQGLDRDPAVARQMQNAADDVLQRDLLIKTVLPMVNEDAIKAQYDKQYAGKPGEPEVHARHILVDSQAKALDIIKQLQAGAKFEDLAKKYSDPKDPATAQGGDLGTFKKGDMLPEFSDAAFKLKKGDYTTTPVHTRYGWHVIQVLDTSVSTPPAYDSVHDEIRQALLRQDAQVLEAKARDLVKIVSYGPDGKSVKVVPPAAAATTPAAPAKK